MGLDMYLRANRYVSGFDFETDDNKRVYNRVCDALRIDGACTGSPSINVAVTAAYWRKANQIHNWFVKNIQSGKDDCKEYPVSIEKLKELLLTCKVVASKSVSPQEYLPTTTGCFFGSVEYGEYYYRDIEDTIEALEFVLKTYSPTEYTFAYHSSW